jgi:prenyltransferase beta subunit
MFKRMVALVVSISLILAIPVWAQEDADPVAQAIDYLKTTQNDDGGFSNGYAPESDLTATADAVIAIALAGHDLEAFSIDETASPLAYLAAQVDDGAAQTTGQIAKVLIAVIAAGEDSEDFAAHNLIDDLLATQSEGGMFGYGAFEHCLALIAVQNAGVDLPEGAVETLADAQAEDGGWGFMASEASDTNTTGLCLQALALADAPETVEAAFAYLAAIQNEDGGWPYQNPSEFGTDSDTNSTALVVQALIANGDDLSEWNNPQDWLVSMQNESGSFSYQAAMPGDNIVATLAVIPALAGMPLNAWALMPEDTE